MSEQSQTNIKFQRELENLLPDNNAKEISAADVRTIVTSNYQPQMIWSGFFDSSNTTGGSVYRTSYVNPNYFRNLWVLTNPGAGLTPGSYTNQVLMPDNSYLSYNFANNGGNSGGAVFNLEVSATGVVSSFTVSCSVFSATCFTSSSGKLTSVSGPEVSKSTITSSCFILFDSGIVSFLC